MQTENAAAAVAEFSSSEDSVIESALRILESRLRKPNSGPLLGPLDVANFLALRLGQLEAERFDVMFLNNNYELIDAVPMFNGTVNQVGTYPREVAKKALQLNATYAVISHNHPGQRIPEPSQPDLAMTERINKTLEVVGVQLLDHIVVAGSKTYSMAAAGVAGL